MNVKSLLLTVVLTACSGAAKAETPEEWITLGARVHGAFGAFIPLGIKIGITMVLARTTKTRFSLLGVGSEWS